MLHVEPANSNDGKKKCQGSRRKLAAAVRGGLAMAEAGLLLSRVKVVGGAC